MDSPITVVAICSWLAASAQAVPYVVVGTGQKLCYDTHREIAPPRPGQPFCGQDAQHPGPAPSYRDNGDGTISDQNTGLMWVKACGEKVTFDQAVGGAARCRVGGHDDWRLPGIKELYSLILFSGTDPSGPFEGRPTPFLDTRFFEFKYGDVGLYAGRIIDAQYWSATRYTGRSFMARVFGVNFADGRIKGYGTEMPGGRTMREYVRYVRGNPSYGLNDFVDNHDGTITDRATGLTWSQDDSGKGLNWEQALAWVQARNAEKWLGHDDWRLPNAKELESLVDYARCPDATKSPAIDPLFHCTAFKDEGGWNDWGYYWTSTTHASLMGGNAAAYVAFSWALGWMERPPGSGQLALEDVHGAGAQRSDPKAGDPREFPYGRGPQGDVIRIYNYVRVVRG